MYTNLNRKGWVYVSNKKSEMIKQQVSANQGQASDNKSGHPVPGKGGKKPGPPKPKNMGKTIKTLMSYVGKYKALLEFCLEKK